MLKLNRKKIDIAIREILNLKIKYSKVDTMFIARGLDEALKQIGWDYANILEVK